MKTRAWVINVDGLHYWNGNACIWDGLNTATLYGSKGAAIDHLDLVFHVYPNSKGIARAVPVSVETRERTAR